MDKLFISADIEGVCGIVDWKETDIGEPQGAQFRAQMSREVNAVCEAANEAGVAEIFVKDAHGSGRSIDPQVLPENVRLMRSWTRDPLSMMAGIDPSFGAAVFVGYHSAGGADGNPLAHTMDSTNLYKVTINGQLASEFMINAYTAASFGVPSILITGDRQLCEGAPAVIPGIRTVAVSEGRGKASISIHPGLAVKRIKAEAAAALAGASGARPLALPHRFEIQVQYREHYLAHRGSFYPGARKVSPTEIAFEAATWMDALRFMYFVF